MNPTLVEAIASIRTSKKVLFVQIILVFIVPIALLVHGIIPISARVTLLSAIVCLLFLWLLHGHWKRTVFEVNREGIIKYMIPYLIFTGLGALFLVGLGEHLKGHEEVVRWWHYPHFLYGFLIVSFFQEIAYRGYLIPALGTLTKNPLWIILANTLLFTYLHAIFPGLLVNLPLAFIGGIAFAIMYIKYPSLPLIILSHAVLNFVAVLYGFFIIPGLTY